MHFLKNPDAWRRRYNGSEQSKDTLMFVTQIWQLLDAIIPLAIQLVWSILAQVEFVDTCNCTANN